MLKLIVLPSLTLAIVCIAILVDIHTAKPDACKHIFHNYQWRLPGCHP